MTNVIVTHKKYGCECDCCGHLIAAYDKKGYEVFSEFVFDEPDLDIITKEAFIFNLVGQYQNRIHGEIKILYDKCEVLGIGHP